MEGGSCDPPNNYRFPMCAITEHLSIDKMSAIKRFIYFSLFVLCVVSVVSAGAEMLAIHAGRIITVSGDEIENGVVLVENGKIKAVGVANEILIPGDAQKIDASNKTIIPGLIDSQSRLFLMDSELNQRSGAVEYNILDAIDSFSDDYKQVLAQGVTSVCVVPVSPSPIAGTAAVLKLNGERSPAKMLLKGNVALKVSIGLSSGSVSSSLMRLEQYASLRETFIAAKSYLKRLEKYEHQVAEYEKKKKEAKEKEAKKKAEDKKEDKPQPDKPAKPAKPEPELKRPKKFPENATYELLVKVLRRKIPLRVEAHRVDDIRHALRLAQEYDFSLILDKCTQGHLVADEISKHKRNVGVIAGPVTTSLVNMPTLEYVDHDSASAGIMSRKGIQVAIGTSARDGTGSKFLLPSAAMAVAGGMDADMALRAVTLTAAEILGVADRVGSIDVGKDADIVVLSGGPLESFTQVEMVLIQGKKVYERKAAK